GPGFNPVDDREPEAPTASTEDRACGVALRRGQLVGGHRRHELGCQEACAVVDAAGQQHLPEGEVVARGRDQPSAAVGEGAWPCPLVVVVERLELPVDLMV